MARDAVTSSNGKTFVLELFSSLQLDVGLSDERYTHFLEYTLASILQNHSNPGSFMESQQVYWEAVTALEGRIDSLISDLANLRQSLRRDELSLKQIEKALSSEGISPERLEAIQRLLPHKMTGSTLSYWLAAFFLLFITAMAFRYFGLISIP